jgi:hypothetical protein
MLIELEILTGLILVAGSAAFLTRRNSSHQKSLPASSNTSTHTLGDLNELKHALSRLRFEEGIETPAERAYDQLQQCQKATEVLKSALNEKFESGELTFARYENVANQVVEKIIENLRNARTAFDTWRAAKSEASEDRLRYLHAQQNTGPVLSDNEKEELRSLEERASQRKRALDDAAGLMATNDRALAELNRVTSAIRSIDTSKSNRSGSDSESLIRELESLAEQAKKYSS